MGIDFTFKSNTWNVSQESVAILAPSPYVAPLQDIWSLGDAVFPLNSCVLNISRYCRINYNIAHHCLLLILIGILSLIHATQDSGDEHETCSILISINVATLLLALCTYFENTVALK